MNRTALYKPQKQAGATFTDRFGWEIVSYFGSAATEYRAATENVALLDLSYTGRFKITGKDALDLLNRLSSNKVDLLIPGIGAATVLPTNKGRVIDLLYLLATDDGLLMMTSPQTRQRVADWADFHTFLEDMVVQDITETTGMITLLGPQAPKLLEHITDKVTGPMNPYESTRIIINDKEVLLTRTDPTGLPGYNLIIPIEEAEHIWLTCASHATTIGDDTYNTLRIENQMPRYGWELNETVNPWEVGLHPFIHLDKGCYIGQEVILRLYNYNKIQRKLVALTFSTTEDMEGATLHSGSKAAGTVTSAVEHPITGQTIGLGVVRSEFSEPNTKLNALNLHGEQIGEAIVENRVYSEIPILP